MIMRHCIILLIGIFVGFSISVKAQNEKTAIVKEVNGIVFLKFIEKGEYYCMLKSTILIDSTSYDFMPERNSNIKILHKNVELESKIGKANSFGDSSNYMTFKCFHTKDSNEFRRYRCDSVLDVYRRYTILDPQIFNFDYSEPSVLKIISDCIYKSQSNDTVYIIFGLKASVVMYRNIELGPQVDDRIIENDDGTTYFDDSHGTCQFGIYNSTLVVLNRVHDIYKINDNLMNTFNLKKLELNYLKVFLFE